MGRKVRPAPLRMDAEGEDGMKDYKAIADRVLGMLRQADGNDPSRGHLTMNSVSHQSC